MPNETASHHVAWKDRIGFNKIWYENFKAMSETYGTDSHPFMVERAINDIVNIKNGPNLSDRISNKKKEIRSQELQYCRQQWLESNPQKAEDTYYLRDLNRQLKALEAQLLHHFIIQLWEDEGFGFYESTTEEDDVSLN